MGEAIGARGGAPSGPGIDDGGEFVDRVHPWHTEWVATQSGDDAARQRVEANLAVLIGDLMLKALHHVSEAVLSDVMRIIAKCKEASAPFRANAEAMAEFRKQLTFLQEKGLLDPKPLVRYEACKFCSFLYRGQYRSAVTCPNALCPGRAPVSDEDVGLLDEADPGATVRQGNTVDFLYRCGVQRASDAHRSSSFGRTCSR